MFDKKVEYPAVFVLSARRQDPRTGETQILAFPDGVTVNNDAEMGARLGALMGLEEAGALGYTKTLANVADVERVIAERKAELEAEVSGDYSGAVEAYEEAGDGSASPTSGETLRSEEPSNGHSTTNGSVGQLLRLPDITAFRPVWGDPHSTDLDLRHGAQRVRIDVPHREFEATARTFGWREPVSGSGYWLRP
jgi:hypothetical protein